MDCNFVVILDTWINISRKLGDSVKILVLVKCRTVGEDLRKQNGTKTFQKGWSSKKLGEGKQQVRASLEIKLNHQTFLIIISADLEGSTPGAYPLLLLQRQGCVSLIFTETWHLTVCVGAQVLLYFAPPPIENSWIHPWSLYKSTRLTRKRGEISSVPCLNSVLSEVQSLLCSIKVCGM